MPRNMTSGYPIVLTITVLLCVPTACRPNKPAITPSAAPPEPTPRATVTSATVHDEPSPTPVPPAQQPETDDEEAGKPTAEATPEATPRSSCDARRADLFREGLIGPAQALLDDLSGASVYEIDLAIANDQRSVDGHQIVCYTNQEDEPLDEIVFRLFPNLLGGTATVLHAQVEGRDVKPVPELEDSALRVPLVEALQPDKGVIVEMDFAVDVPLEKKDNYGLFGLSEGVLTLHEIYPVIPVYDDEGWNAELPPPQADITYYDASFYRVRVRAPKDLVVVASGVEVKREEPGDDQVLTCVAGPARGFYLAASEDYAVVSDTVGETTVNSYAPAGQTKGADLALRIAAAALASFNKRFGVYPYTEFDLVSTPMLALGMEYPGVVAITDQVYATDGTVRGAPASIMMEGTVAHEVAHQWFYNVVGNDQVDEPWLDEAVVQYVTGLYHRDTYGEDGYQGWRDSWYSRWDRVDRAEIPIGLPVRDYEAAEYGAIVYGRGPLFVEALSKEMGQETFDAFLRDYYRSHAWGIGTGEAFRLLAERHCQCDLTALFEQWVWSDDEASAPSSSGQAVGRGGAQGWAVLTEKDDYTDVDMTDLPVDHIGISQMRQTLEDAGWDLDQILDLKEFDGKTLQDGLDWLEENAAQDDLVLVYVAAHGRYLSDILQWDGFFAEQWEEIPSRRRVLVLDTCQAANYTGVIATDPAPYLSVAAVDGDEYGWSGLEEEGLPIIGGVFTHYFAAAFANGSADTDGDGCVSVQEAALLAEERQRTYMQEVVFAVPEFLEMYHQAGSRPEEDPTFPDVIIDDTIGEPLCLELDGT